MTLLLRALRLVVLATWVGGIFFFGFVAKVAFTQLSSPHEAGILVRGSLLELHHIGFAAGLLYLALTLGLLMTQRDTHPVRAAELALVLVMLVLTAYSQFSIIPRMERDRLALGGDVAATLPDTPQHRHFDRLHNVSVKFEGAILLQGLLLLALAAVHGRDDFDRFA